MRYVGKIISGQDVLIGEKSPNQHLIISGISGSGKSVRIADIERHIVKDGGTVIAFDINGTHEQMPDVDKNLISAQKDGLDVKFLDMSLVNTGEETMSNLVEYVKKTLCPRQMRGACQLNAVRKAIQFAIKNRTDFDNEIEAIAHGMNEMDDPAAAGAYNHLCPILEGRIFRKSAKKIESGKLNIICLRGLNLDTQKRVVEIILAVMWRQMRMVKSQKEKWISTLSRLHIGQAIAVGELEINGRAIQQPIVTKSDYPRKKQGVPVVVNGKF